MSKTIEIEMFFQIASELHQAARNGHEPAARLVREELEVMMLYTANAALRTRCARELEG
jgi:hypothetical protein